MFKYTLNDFSKLTTNYSICINSNFKIQNSYTSLETIWITMLIRLQQFMQDKPVENSAVSLKNLAVY